MYQKKSSNKTGIIATILICITMAVISVLLINNRQYIIDQFTVWQYTPSPEIENLMDRSGVGDHGKFLFYSGQPKLDGTQEFNDECDRVENMTAILGCYSDWKIYVYNVTDSQLDGIREVTATHEMLHAAYVRLGVDEQNKINNMLEIEYDKLKQNKDFTELMDFYGRTEPGQRHNELHSVIGTEVGSVNSELEKYYTKYFSDRAKIVELNAKYKGVFEELETRASDLARQLNDLSANIKNSSSQYNIDVADLNSDISVFNKKANNGGFSTINQFNNEKAVLLARVSQVESDRDGINSNIAKYNELLNEYNSIASQSKKLNNSIDSTLAPAPSVQ